MCLGPVLRSKRNHCNEKPKLCNKSPYSLQLEKAHVHSEDPVQPKVVKQIHYLKCPRPKKKTKEKQRGGSLDPTMEDTPLTLQCLDVICSVALSVLF